MKDGGDAIVDWLIGWLTVSDEKNRDLIWKPFQQFMGGGKYYYPLDTKFLCSNLSLFG